MISALSEAFRGVQTDGVPVLFPTTDQVARGVYLPAEFAKDLHAVFEPMAEAAGSGYQFSWPWRWDVDLPYEVSE